MTHVLRECTKLDDDMSRALKSKGFTFSEKSSAERQRWASRIAMDWQALHRNKRTLLAYHQHRLGKIKEICWDLGSGGFGGEPPEFAKKLMSQNEIEFSREYSQLVLDYANSVEGDILGLTTQTLKAPKDFWIAVRVVQEAGTIVTESGYELDLRLGMQLWVARNEVEHLIQQGTLVEVPRGNRG